MLNKKAQASFERKSPNPIDPASETKSEAVLGLGRVTTHSACTGQAVHAAGNLIT